MEKAINLDILDKKILAVLLKCGRISLKELAKLINNNYPTVINRVNRLIQNDVIRHFYPVLQIPGIGVRRYFSLYLTLKSIPEERRKKIIEGFTENPFLIEVLELEGGKHNFSLLLVSNSIQQAEDTINNIQQICGDSLMYLENMPTYTITPVNRKFFMEEDFEIDYDKITTGFQLIINKTKLVSLGKHLKLNEEDIKLLNYLKLNAKDGLEEIKEKTGLNTSVINYKIEKYLTENLITYFTIELNHEKIGYYQYLLFLNFKGDVEKKEKLKKELFTKIKEAYHLFEYMNYWEVVVTYCVRNQSKMDEIISDLKKRYGEDIQYQLMYIKKKHKTEPYPDVEKVYPKN